MSRRVLSRRSFLVLTTSSLVITAIQASCTPATTSTPAPESKSATSPQSAAPTKPAEAPKPAATSAAAPTAAGKSSTSAPVELRVAHTWPADRWQEQVDFDKMFMEKHPNIKLSVTNTEWNEYFRKRLAEAGANSLPDIMYMQDTRISQWVRQGSFRSLDPYVKADKEFNIDDLATEAVKLCTFKGQLYGIPYDWGGPCLVYNKTMFDEANINYPDETWTTDNLLDAALKMTVPGKQWGWDYNYIGNWAMESMYFRPFGADVFNEDETAATLDSEAGIKAMEFWSDILLEHKAAPTPSEKQAVQTVPFAVGKVAMFYAPPWQEPTFIKFGGDQLKWDVAPMPKGPVAQSSAAMGSNYAITKDSKNPDAAWTYMSNYMSKEGMEFMWSCRGTGLPTRKSAQPCFLNAPTHPPGAQYWVEAVNTYMKMGRPVAPAADEVIRIMTREYDNLFLGNATVKETHEAIKKQLDPILAKNKE